MMRERSRALAALEPGDRDVVEGEQASKLERKAAKRHAAWP